MRKLIATIFVVAAAATVVVFAAGPKIQEAFFYPKPGKLPPSDEILTAFEL
jgi:hypothetical protein